jgi:outer membrane protein
MKKLPLIFLCAGLMAGAAEPKSLTLAEARQLALQHHPRITAADLNAFAARERVKEARAAYFPTITANVTAVGTAEDNTRIAAGGLSNSGIFDRNAEGIIIQQIITDFGRTANLTAAAKFHASAESANVDATRAQVLLLTDVAYFEALRAAAVLDVARQTLTNREVLLDQVSALASNKLKSELDVNFARVAHDEARMLQLQAEGELNAAYARLAMLTGFSDTTEFQLRDIATPVERVESAPGTNLVREALAHRPELRQLGLEAQAAGKFAKAEKAAGYPTLSAIAAGGVIPVHDSHFDDEYGAAGVNLSIPLFAGGAYSARAKEARAKAEAAEELFKAREEEIVRDVKIAELTANTAFERIAVAERMSEHANQTYSLAEAKYSVGGVSIVELSQAQLSKATAAIQAASARYNYEMQLSNLKYQAGILSGLGPATSPK